MALNIKTTILGLMLAVAANSATAWTEIDSNQRFVPTDGPGKTFEWSWFDRDGSTAFGPYVTGLEKTLDGKHGFFDLVATICARPENTCVDAAGYKNEGVSADQQKYLLPVGFAPKSQAAGQPATAEAAKNADLGKMEPAVKALAANLTPVIKTTAAEEAKKAAATEVAKLKSELAVTEEVTPPLYYAEASALAIDLGVSESWITHDSYKVAVPVGIILSFLLIVAVIYSPAVVTNRLRIRRNARRMDALEQGQTDLEADLIGEEGMVTLQSEALIDQQVQINELRDELTTTRGVAEGAGNLARTAIDIAEDVRAQLPDHVDFNFDQQLTNGRLGHLLDELAGGELITWMSGDGQRATLVLKAADVPGKVLVVNGVDKQTQPVNIKNLLPTLKRAWKRGRVTQVALLEKAS